MAKFIKVDICRIRKEVLNKFFLIIIFFSLLVRFATPEDQLENARILFLQGNYEQAIETTNKIKTVESLILKSRILSIYTNFYLHGKKSEESFLVAYQTAKKAIEMDPTNDEAYVEAAHALGRYGQKIGIMSAITKGIADRVKRYLDKALKINDNNILANLSKGIWHAEIINQAGKTVAKAVYGARTKNVLFHFKKVKEQKNSKEIGILYELAYGYSLLNEEIYLKEAKTLILELLVKNPSSDMDKVYIKKASSLIEILP